MNDRELLEAAAKAVSYNAESGLILWLPKPASEPDAQRWNARYAGKEAGTLDDRGYVRIALLVDGKKRRFRAHQLAWFIAHGQSAKGEIDHIDQFKTNNKIANLRDVDRSTNQRNGTRKGNNTSGAPGVTWHKARRKWCAQANVNGKHHHIGLFASKSDAEVAATDFRRAHGFTETHGRRLA